jgi:hypothetical protein
VTENDSQREPSRNFPPGKTGNNSSPEAKLAQTPFEKLQTLLHFLGFETLLIPESAENPAEQLMISSGKEEDEKGFMLQMMFISDLLKAANAEEFKEDKDSAVFLQFFSLYPVEVMQEKYWDLFRLMAIFSELLPMGNFGQNNDGIYFRYCFAVKGRELDNKLIVEMLNIMRFFLDKYGMKLVDFASNDKSVEDTIHETELEIGRAAGHNQ